MYAEIVRCGGATSPLSNLNSLGPLTSRLQNNKGKVQPNCWNQASLIDRGPTAPGWGFVCDVDFRHLEFDFRFIRLDEREKVFCNRLGVLVVRVIRPNELLKALRVIHSHRSVDVLHS